MRWHNGLTRRSRNLQTGKVFPGCLAPRLRAETEVSVPLIDYLRNRRAHRLPVFKEDIWQFFNFGC